jgi:transketolase
MKELNPRVVYGETLRSLGEKDQRVVALEADLGGSTMSCLFERAFPDRFFEMGIAEQNMASFAAGLAIEGKIPFIHSFAVFASGRAYDQIRQGICIGNVNVKIVGSSSGLSDFGDGATHQSIEDTALMCSLPNMTVLEPMDAAETEKIVEAAYRHQGPVYIRINRNDLPILYPEDHDFVIGEPVVIREGTDLVVFASGVMVSKAVSAANQLAEMGFSLKVVNVSSLKPLNAERVKELANGVQGIITAQEHSQLGGLASIITSIFKGDGRPIETIGVADRFGQSAKSYEDLLQHYGLTEDEIVASAQRILRR